VATLDRLKSRFGKRDEKRVLKVSVADKVRADAAGATVAETGIPRVAPRGGEPPSRAGSGKPGKSSGRWTGPKARFDLVLHADRVDAVLRFGKHTGKRVSELAKDEKTRGYLFWIMSESKATPGSWPMALIDVIAEYTGDL